MVKNAATSTPETTGLRRCTGSKTFGIEPHEAAIADFPIQPSRKDGLGTMCKPHWTEYTRALRQAQRARQGAPDAPGAVDAPEAAPAATTAKRGARGAKPAPAPDPELQAATDLVARVDALPADEYVRRIGSDDVQAALQVVAKGRGYRDPVEPTSYEA